MACAKNAARTRWYALPSGSTARPCKSFAASVSSPTDAVLVKRSKAPTLLAASGETIAWTNGCIAASTASAAFGVRHFFQHQAEHGVAPRAAQRERQLCPQEPERALQIHAVTLHREGEVLLASGEGSEGLGEAEILA